MSVVVAQLRQRRHERVSCDFRFDAGGRRDRVLVVVFLCESRRDQERAMEEGLEERGLSGSLDSAFLF